MSEDRCRALIRADAFGKKKERKEKSAGERGGGGGENKAFVSPSKTGMRLKMDGWMDEKSKGSVVQKSTKKPNNYYFSQLRTHDNGETEMCVMCACVRAQAGPIICSYAPLLQFLLVFILRVESACLFGWN